MNTVRKGSADDPRSLAMRITNLERQLGMDTETHLIDATQYGSSARWALFEDSNADAYTGITTTATRLALLPVFTYIGTRGQWVGWFTVRAAVTGSGRARVRLYDYIALSYVSECSWSFDFNATTSTVLVMDGHHSLKSQSGSVRYGLVVDRESGTGSFDVGIDDGKLSVLVVGQTGSSSEPAPGSQLFEYTGAADYFTVPSNVFEVTVTMYGAAGGDGPGSGTQGRGGYMKCSVPVTPGQVLQVNVGGRGAATTGGFNGGGDTDSGGYGGGGASDIRVYPYALADRRVVAGGGGGEGATTGSGGHGGYTDGLSGTGNYSGLGGSQSAGGGAAGGAATAGSLGQGGVGDAASGSRIGGGGGGGYYGGGGGYGELGLSDGGGGGGSSYYDSSAGIVLIEEADGTGPTTNTATVLFEW